MKKRNQKKDLTMKQLRVEAKKYSKLKNKSGAYQRLVGTYGKWNARMILEEADRFFRKFPKSSIILKPTELPKSAFYTVEKLSKQGKGAHLQLLPPMNSKWITMDPKDLPKGAKLKTTPPDGDGFTYTYIVTPTFGKSRLYDHFPIVVKIGKRKYEVDVQPRPISGDIDEQDVSPYKQQWDHKNVPYQQWDQGSKRKIIFTPTRKKLTRATKKTVKTSPFIPAFVGNTYGFIEMFGQAHPVQNAGSIAPVYKGKIARHLMTVDTRWGDDGNETFWLGLDKDGKPAKIYWYATNH